MRNIVAVQVLKGMISNEVSNPLAHLNGQHHLEEKNLGFVFSKLSDGDDSVKQFAAFHPEKVHQINPRRSSISQFEKYVKFVLGVDGVLELDDAGLNENKDGKRNPWALRDSIAAGSSLPTR